MTNPKRHQDPRECHAVLPQVSKRSTLLTCFLSFFPGFCNLGSTFCNWESTNYCIMVFTNVGINWHCQIYQIEPVLHMKGHDSTDMIPPVFLRQNSTETKMHTYKRRTQVASAYWLPISLFLLIKIVKFKRWDEWYVFISATQGALE